MKRLLVLAAVIFVLPAVSAETVDISTSETVNLDIEGNPSIGLISVDDSTTANISFDENTYEVQEGESLETNGFNIHLSQVDSGEEAVTLVITPIDQTLDIAGNDNNDPTNYNLFAPSSLTSFSGTSTIGSFDSVSNSEGHIGRGNDIWKVEGPLNCLRIGDESETDKIEYSGESFSEILEGGLSGGCKSYLLGVQGNSEGGPTNYNLIFSEKPDLSATTYLGNLDAVSSSEGHIGRGEDYWRVKNVDMSKAKCIVAQDKSEVEKALVAKGDESRELPVVEGSIYDISGSGTDNWRDYCDLKEKEDKDLADVNKIFSNAKIVYPADGREELEKKTADQIASDLGLEQVSDDQVYSSTKEDNNLIVVGGPAVNTVSQELASNGEIPSASEINENQGRLDLVEDAFADGKHVIVVWGYDHDARQNVKDYFLELMDGQNLEQAEGLDSLTLTVKEQGPSSICPDCGKPQDTDNDGLYEDVNGDGETDISDASLLAKNLGVSADYFDFTNDGKMDVFDVSQLSNEIKGKVAKGQFVMDDGERFKTETGTSIRLEQVTGDSESEEEAVVEVAGNLETMSKKDTLSLEGGKLQLLDVRAVGNGKGIAALEFTGGEEKGDLKVDHLEAEKNFGDIYEIKAKIRDTGVEYPTPEKEISVEFLPSGFKLETAVDEDNTVEVRKNLNVRFSGKGQSIMLETGKFYNESKYHVKLTGVEEEYANFSVYKDGEAGVREKVLQKGEVLSLGETHFMLQQTFNFQGSNDGVKLEEGDMLGESSIVGIRIDPENKIEESNEGNNMETVKIVENETDRTYQPMEISLHEGWNMISVPSVGGSQPAEGFYISQLEEQCQLQEFEGETSWRLEDGEWKHPNAVESSQGVYVKSSESCDAQLDPKMWPTTADPVPKDRKLEKGWNLISVPKPMTLSQINGCEFGDYQGTSVWHYLGDGEWQQLGASVNELKPDRGYLVVAKQDCKINFKSSIEGPPTPSGNFFKEVERWIK